jgi:hypothetical protein
MLSLVIAFSMLNSTPEPDCTPFLTGHWVGSGVVTGFGKPVKVSNDYRFKRDGTFTTVNKYLGSDGRWTTQTLSGRWTASAAGQHACTLSLVGSGPSAGSSSQSTLTIVGPDTFRSLGFDMKRAPG